MTEKKQSPKQMLEEMYSRGCIKESDYKEVSTHLEALEKLKKQKLIDYELVFTPYVLTRRYDGNKLEIDDALKIREAAEKDEWK